MGKSLYERIGGDDAVLAAVNRFYLKVTRDARTKDFFSELDIGQQVKKQVEFMRYAFGAAPAYNGQKLREAHAPLLDKGLGDGHFDAVLDHLEATLSELGVAESDIAEAMLIVDSTRNDVLGR